MTYKKLFDREMEGFSCIKAPDTNSQVTRDSSGLGFDISSPGAVYPSFVCPQKELYSLLLGWGLTPLPHLGRVLILQIL